MEGAVRIGERSHHKILQRFHIVRVNDLRVVYDSRVLVEHAAARLVELVGEEEAFTDPAGALATLAERVARTWSR
jgi:hypothetical protein